MEENKAGVLWNGGYNPEYLKYEKELPHAFPWSRDTSEDDPRYVKGEDGYWYRPGANESGKAVLTCTGDLMCEPLQQEAYKFGSNYYFHPMFRHIRDFLRDSDFVVGNLETTLTECTPYAGEWHLIEHKYHCNAPESFLDALRYAGFDALVNANNHNCDSGVTGLIDTLDAMDRHGFMHTGTFRPGEREWERCILVNINGIKVAIMAYATGYNHMDDNFTDLGRRKLLNMYYGPKIKADIQTARKRGAEFVIVYMHWGIEHSTKISEYQGKWAQRLANFGADYIVGSHPHCLQRYEVLTAEDGRQVPVVFSMGNFVTNETMNISKRTGVLQLVLAREDGKVRLQNEYFVPCFVFTKVEDSRFAVAPTDTALNRGVSNPVLDNARKYAEEVMRGLPAMTSASIRISELCKVLGVKMPAGVKNRGLSRMCSQLESVTSGCAYFTLGGFDRNDVLRAHRRGAAAVVSTEAVDGVPCIVVPDVTEAFWRASAHIKSRFGARTVAITGTSGKTATKELLEQVMRERYLTLSSAGSAEPDLHFIDRLRPYHECYLQEVRTDRPEFAAVVSRSIMPDYAVITNIHETQMEEEESDEAYIKHFTDITAGLKEGGVLFVNGDDQRLMNGIRNMADRHFRVVTFGLLAAELDYRGQNIRQDGKAILFDIVYGDRRESLYIPSPMHLNMYNAMAAFAVARELGIPEAQIFKAIASHAGKSRLKTALSAQNYFEYKGLHMMLDWHNATPMSTWSAVEVLSNIAVEPGGRRIAVLGDLDINEENAEAVHRNVGKQVAESSIDYLYCCGDHARFIREEAVRLGFDEQKALFCGTNRELELALSKQLRPGDTLLIKGGRRSKLGSSIRKLFGITVSLD